VAQAGSCSLVRGRAPADTPLAEARQALQPTQDGGYCFAMEIGTIGEWVGAIATAGATVVALYFGVRDNESAKVRHTARADLHGFAQKRLLHVSRWDAQFEEPDGERMRGQVLDAECADAMLIVGRMGRVRAKRATRVLSELYGARSVKLAQLYPATIHAADGPAKDPYGDTDMARLLETNAGLLVDETEPLRIRGAGKDTRLRAQLRLTLERLASV